MTTALNLATLTAVPAQPASSQAQATSSAGAGTGDNPSFSQVLAGQSSNNTTQNPKTSNNAPEQTPQASQQTASAASSGTGAEAAGPTGNATSPVNGKPTGKGSAKNDSQDDSIQTPAIIALGTLDGAVVNQVLPVHQATQQTVPPQTNPTVPSLPQQALEIAAQVAAVQTQVASRQASQVASQGSTPSSNTPVATSAPTTKSTTSTAFGAAATALPTAASPLQDTANPAIEPAAHASTALAQPIAQPAVSAPAQTQTRTQPQDARLTAANNSVNPVASTAKQAIGNSVRSAIAKTGDDAPSTTQQSQVPVVAAQPVIPTLPQHAAVTAAQAGVNLASLSSISSTTGSQSVTSASPSQVPAVINLTATPVGSAQWNADLGRQMVLLSSNSQTGNQTAELRLDPPNLGPLHVTISLTDGVASAAFVSAHAVVRQALESAMPQLQTAFEQAGLSLGQTSVGDQNTQSSQQQASSDQSGRSSSIQAVDGNNTAAAVLRVSATRDANALVDTFV